uniref:Putative conserved secreted protein n=1 Tax=Ixodes ricinus TaxID=34613 RepID=A0A6B0V371_IXORI
MWKVLAVFYALCSAVIAEDNNSCKNVTSSEVQEKLFNTFTNTLFDKVLSSVAKSRTIDRVSLPNIVHNFTSKVIVKISAQVSLYRGILEGLSSLTRTGNCRFEVGECGIDIKADLGAGPLNSSFVGLVRVMGFGQAVTVDVNVQDLRILLGLAQTPGSQLELTEFKVQQLRGVTVAMHGLKLLSKVFNKLLAELTNLFEVQIKDAIEKKIREGVAVQIRKLNNITFF